MTPAPQALAPHNSASPNSAAHLSSSTGVPDSLLSLRNSLAAIIPRITRGPLFCVFRDAHCAHWDKNCPGITGCFEPVVISLGGLPLLWCPQCRDLPPLWEYPQEQELTTHLLTCHALRLELESEHALLSPADLVARSRWLTRADALRRRAFSSPALGALTPTDLAAVHEFFHTPHPLPAPSPPSPDTFLAFARYAAPILGSTWSHLPADSVLLLCPTPSDDPRDSISSNHFLRLAAETFRIHLSSGVLVAPRFVADVLTHLGVQTQLLSAPATEVALLAAALFDPTSPELCTLDNAVSAACDILSRPPH